MIRVAGQRGPVRRNRTDTLTALTLLTTDEPERESGAVHPLSAEDRKARVLRALEKFELREARRAARRRYRYGRDRA